jgi:predicted nucleotidyltransferase
MQLPHTFRQALCAYFHNRPVARVWLFGSAARGEAEETSDIDLLLELDKGVSLFDFARFKLELEAMLRKKVDLVSSNGISPRLRPDIERDKQLIYERQTGR